jgi:hypothetical protein
MRIVNGYACANCHDVSLAKRGVGPRKPDEDPLKPGPARERDPFGAAVSFGGNLAGAVGPAAGVERLAGVNLDIRA